MLVDSHCHRYLERDGDLDEAVERARQAGVGTIVTICTKVSEFETIKRIAERYDDIWCTVGIDPHEVARESQVTTAQLLKLNIRKSSVSVRPGSTITTSTALERPRKTVFGLILQPRGKAACRLSFIPVTRMTIRWKFSPRLMPMGHFLA